MSVVEMSNVVMQVQNYSEKSTHGNEAEYKGSIDAIHGIYKSEGVQYGIFNGFGITTLRLTLGMAIYFGTYKICKDYLKIKASKGYKKTAKVLLAGGISGIFLWGICFPIDSLKSMV